MEGDALLPLHEVRRDERGRAARRAARSHRGFGRGPKPLRTLAPFGVLLWLLSCTRKKVTSRLFSPAGENSPPRVAWQKPVPAATKPAAAGSIRKESKGCFFSCKKHPSCRCAAIHPPKIRFYGKRVPRFAKRGQRRCLWNPQPLKRLAKLLHKPGAAGGKALF